MSSKLTLEQAVAQADLLVDRPTIDTAIAVDSPRSVFSGNTSSAHRRRSSANGSVVTARRSAVRGPVSSSVRPASSAASIVPRSSGSTWCTCTPA